MDQTVKILYLTTNQILITELVEVAAVDIGAPDCKMVNPFILKGSAEEMLNFYYGGDFAINTALFEKSFSHRTSRKCKLTRT